MTWVVGQATDKQTTIKSADAVRRVRVTESDLGRWTRSIACGHDEPGANVDGAMALLKTPAMATGIVAGSSGRLESKGLGRHGRWRYSDGWWWRRTAVVSSEKYSVIGVSLRLGCPFPT